MSWLSRLWAKDQAADSPAPNPATEVGVKPGEVRPPWVEHPGIPPWDFFWREAGEPWKSQVWEPYYNPLSEPEKAEYLKRWNVPKDWYSSYFDTERREFWEHVDDEDES